MKMTLTAKLKLQTGPEQFQALRKTQLAYRDALNAVSQYAFAHGKISNQRTLQRQMYDEIRLLYQLPAQMACNVPRQVGATYKTLWTKVKQNAKMRKQGRTKKRYKGLDTAPKYVSPTLTYNYQRDYSLKSDQHPHSLIGLENLTDIREHSKRTRGKHASKKQRRANQHASRWAFAELHSILAYKAASAGSLTVKVDAHFTSQACPTCGYTSKANRPAQGLLFVCQSCHYMLHADLVGARNIALRTLLIRQAWMSTGQLSVAPDVSDGEAKAARLQKYAELRWSPDTSPLSFDMG